MVAKILPLLSCALIVSAGEHSGAYSSPQYAKKMYPKIFDSNALLPHENKAVPFKRHVESIDRFDSDNNDTSGRASFYDSAGSFLSDTGSQVVSTLAKDFIARSTGSSQVGFDCISQVLSLNLTNLVILIVLKALILAAGFFGAGAWKGGHHYARSLDDNKNATYITQDEIMLYLSYLAGQQSQDYGCLYQLSCQRPHQAALYSSGAELLLQGAKLVQGNYIKPRSTRLKRIVPFQMNGAWLLQGAKLLQANSIELDRYEDISKNIKEAANWGEKGMNCDTRYQCTEKR